MLFDLAALREFHYYWKRIDLTGKPGTNNDLDFFQDDDWLQDSAVIERIHNTNNTWEVSLVFADPKTPNRFLVKKIRTCTDFKKAKVSADYMRRIAAKDPRGTISMDHDDFSLFDN